MSTAHELSKDLINRFDPDGEVLAVFNALQGEVSHDRRQDFRVERKRVRKEPKLKLEMREYIVKDQFTNLYVVFVANLIDGERHCVPTRVGSEAKGLRQKYAHFHKFSDNMLTYLQQEAFVLFGRQTVEIMRARQVANVVTMIETTNDSAVEIKFVDTRKGVPMAAMKLNPAVIKVAPATDDAKAHVKLPPVAEVIPFPVLPALKLDIVPQTATP